MTAGTPGFGSLYKSGPLIESTCISAELGPRRGAGKELGPELLGGGLIIVRILTAHPVEFL